MDSATTASAPKDEDNDTAAMSSSTIVDTVPPPSPSSPSSSAHTDDTVQSEKEWAWVASTITDTAKHILPSPSISSASSFSFSSSSSSSSTSSSVSSADDDEETIPKQIDATTPDVDNDTNIANSTPFENPDESQEQTQQPLPLLTQQPLQQEQMPPQQQQQPPSPQEQTQEQEQIIDPATIQQQLLQLTQQLQKQIQINNGIMNNINNNHPTISIQKQLLQLTQSNLALEQQIQEEKEFAFSLSESLKTAACKIVDLDKEKEEWYENGGGGGGANGVVVIGHQQHQHQHQQQQQRGANGKRISSHGVGKRPSFYQDNFSEHFFPIAAPSPSATLPSTSTTSPTATAAAATTNTSRKLSLPARYATSMARQPTLHLLTALVLSILLSFIALKFGEFEVEVNNAGWWSRGTEISNRATQELVVSLNRRELFFGGSDGDGDGDGDDVWQELQQVTQPNWQGGGDDTDKEEKDDATTNDKEKEGSATTKDDDGSSKECVRTNPSDPTTLCNDDQEVDVDDAVLENICSGEWYGSKKMTSGGGQHLFGMWKTADAESSSTSSSSGGGSLLEANALYDLCIAEANTLAALENANSCYKCPSIGSVDVKEEKDECIAPYSLVLMARLYLANNYTAAYSTMASNSISCENLRSAWTPVAQAEFTSMLQTCVDWSLRLVQSSDNATSSMGITWDNELPPCLYPQFLPTVIDDLFPSSNPPIVRYTSSYYATKKSDEVIEQMYEDAQSDNYDGGNGDFLSGVYDTTKTDFYDFYSDSIVGRDMTLAVGSAGVTIIAMLIHTKSPFLTLMGLLQILLSFPLAYFVYYFIAGLVFFPFLNFIGIFVVFALGADDVFVAVDKWKNARHELPHGTTEQVAALALPDAAYAMLLTSTTTAVAFFGTAICPVAPIVCFAVFCGLLITFDYLMNIFLVFPALCMYDKWLLNGSRNPCLNFDWCCKKKEDVDIQTCLETVPSDEKSNAKDTELADTKRPNSEDDEEQATFEVENKDLDSDERHEELDVQKQALIHRILDGYYNILHRFRWYVLAIVFVATIICTVFAAKLTLPVSSEVAILPASNPYQMHRVWSEKLMSAVLAKGEGSEALIIWGVNPSDTGDHLNPDSWTKLVLDNDFDPGSKRSQSYLLGFCDRLFENDFAGKISSEYGCPMNQFDEWLKDQSILEAPADSYIQNCEGANAVPVPPDVFHPCIISWTKLVNETYILQEKGTVKVMQVRTLTNVVFDSPFQDSKREWNAYEDWLGNERNNAPIGVNGMYHSSLDFWWFDTNGKMLKTAYGAAGIALVCAAVVVFVSSRSFVLTIFAALSICYVLVAATACLVGLGWELGFLESILFAILIGISCDFVIHFGHAYTMYPGSVNRHYRAHFALTHMGPSILAAAFTTLMAAIVMVFTEITFFQKFAVILFMTIIHSTLGSFVVFLVLCDCIGPSEPTKTYDTIKAKICSLRKQS